MNAFVAGVGDLVTVKEVLDTPLRILFRIKVASEADTAVRAEIRTSFRNTHRPLPERAERRLRWRAIVHLTEVPALLFRRVRRPDTIIKVVQVVLPKVLKGLPIRAAQTVQEVRRCAVLREGGNVSKVSETR